VNSKQKLSLVTMLFFFPQLQSELSDRDAELECLRLTMKARGLDAQAEPSDLRKAAGNVSSLVCILHLFLQY